MDFIFANIFLALTAFTLLVFITFAGMDLGIAVILPKFKQDERRVLFSIAHLFWDVNETWLIMAAVFLITFFTASYGIVISIFYIPVILLLTALAIRGCAFEFSSKIKEKEKLWHNLLSGSSITMILIFGVFVGNLIHGLNINSNGKYLGSLLDLFNIYSVIWGLKAIAGFTIIGGSWILIRAYSVEIQQKTRNILKYAIITSFSTGLTNFALLFCNQNFHNHILSSTTRQIISGTLFLLTNATLCKINGEIKKTDNNSKIFILNILFIAFGALFGLSLIYPYIIPYKLTIYDILRFNSSTYKFWEILSLIISVLAIVSFYFIKNYLTFKAKIKEEIHY